MRDLRVPLMLLRKSFPLKSEPGYGCVWTKVSHIDPNVPWRHHGIFVECSSLRREKKWDGNSIAVYFPVLYSTVHHRDYPGILMN